MSPPQTELRERTVGDETSPGPLTRQPALRGALVLALLCEMLVVFWIVASEVPGKVFISSWSIVMPGIFLLALLAMVRRWFPHFYDSHAMLLVYVCLSATACLVGYGALQLMFPAVSWMRYYSTYPSWSRMMALLPDWVAPKDRDVLRGLFYGNSVPDLWMWLPTMLAWGGMSFVFAVVMIALALLVSRSWIREEKLTFPIVMLPLEMCQPRTPLWRSGLFWFGFAVPAVLESLLALNFYFPSVPAIQLKHVDFTTFLFPDRPWSAGAPWLIGFTPFVIGFAFLAPADISFSVFLFGIGDRLALVLAAYLGWDLPSAGSYARRMPYLAQQNVGAFMAFGGLVLWRWVRRYRQRAHERWEAGAVAVALVGVMLLAVFFRLLGMAWWTGLLLIGTVLMYAIALSRVRAESGAAWAFGSFGGAHGNMVSLLGSGSFSQQSIAALGVSQWYAADLRFLPMPFHFEAFKMADSAGWNRRRTAGVLVLATLLGIAVGSVVILYWSYALGWSTAKVYYAITASSIGLSRRADDWFRNPMPVDTVGLQWAGVGALVVVALAWLRQQFLWFPLHPVGYVLAHTGTGLSFWSHYGIAWVLKVLVLRFGGMRLYQRTLPLVFGVILGDILTQTLWSAMAVILNVPVYQFVS
ncbi:MAG: hypothetical protein KatS3mg022_1866 [Armatimonadota bacterium]|nr:MAG: hypothetical protein KatS3mg022_1866 [Armatimonadota bacterium]